tara:strand:- start:214 stop:498 length:285 start_codon:yes stop_codon:yes gene_type:complete
MNNERREIEKHIQAAFSTLSTVRFALTADVDNNDGKVDLPGLRGLERELRSQLCEIAAADIAENILSCGCLPGSGCECEVHEVSIGVRDLYRTN